MKKIDVVTIGSAVKDIMFYSDEISIMKGKELTRQKLIGVEYGAKIELDNVHVNYGGGALNVAVGLKNFGLNVAPMVNLGQRLGRSGILLFHERARHKYFIG